MPKIIVGLEIDGGSEGTNQLITVFAVEDEPVAKIVGLKHVNVCVSILALTFGAVVFDNTITGNGVWQPFPELPPLMATNVHIPGIVVIVDDVPLKLVVGMGTVNVLPGGKKAYCIVPPPVVPVLAAPIKVKLVELDGAQPNVKFVLLDTLNVGCAAVDVIVIDFVLTQPFTSLTVTTVT